MNWLLVGTGGVIGALLRFSLSQWIGPRYFVSFPFATLCINITGSFLLGLFIRTLAGWFPGAHSQAYLLLCVGVCGAYTTFSTFAYEFTILAREGRTAAALWYAGLSGVLGLAAAGLGMFGWAR